MSCAADAALATLTHELSPVLGTRAPDEFAASTASRDWAASGAMHLTGYLTGPPRLSPGGPASWMRAAASFVPGGVGDAAALLGERAVCANLCRQAPVSVGGSYRSLRALDGWFGLTLARAMDVELLPALIEGPVPADPWDAVAGWVAHRRVAEAEARARMLGLAGARIRSHPGAPTRPAVRVRRGGYRDRSSRPVVVDLSSLWAGPLCADLLARAGARVIKVESWRRPDGARYGPRSFYDLLHGGHESVALDLATPGGRAALAGLVRQADLVIEASRPRALQQLGVCAEEHVAAGTIWLSISAYGRSEGDRVGFGDDVAAAAGLVVDDGDGPYPVGDAIADPLTGITAAAAASAALGSERGWLIDVSMRDVAASAARLGSDNAALVQRGGQWWVECAGELTPIRPPRVRPTRAPASDLGAHTDSVLAEFRLAKELVG